MLTTGPSLSDQAYRAIRLMITTGELQRGLRITERALGDQLGVSATPIREAFRRLEHEGLIERRDGRNVTVVDPSAADLLQLTMIQGALRGVAARLAAQAASDGELAALSALHEQSRRPAGRETAPADRIKVTARFHEMIDRAAHNDLLADMIASTTAFDMTERIRAVEVLGDRYPADTGLDEHAEILEALRDRDGERAELLMRAHVSRTGSLFLGLRDDPDHRSGSGS